MSFLRWSSLAVLLGLTFAPLVARAQELVPMLINPGDISVDALQHLAQVALQAVTSGNWALLAALVLVGLVWAVRRWGASKVPFLASARGGALLALLGGIVGAVATALTAGAPVTAALLLKGLTVGVTAAGGWTVVRKLLFGDSAQVAIRRAEAAGQVAAVAAAPGATVESIIGRKL